jgi:hypothetical protein
MGECKNIECCNETEGKRVYCSLSCRNYHVNKYLRDYNKNAEGVNEKSKNRYSLTPKKCKNCGGDIAYDSRDSDYCSKKCSSVCVNLNRKGIKLTTTTEGTKNKSISNRERHGNKFGEYELNPNTCCNCNTKLSFKKRNNSYCSKPCRNEFNRKNMDVFTLYKANSAFKFSLNEFPNEFDFSLIKKFGWYSPSNSKKPNIGGVSRDHMISVKEGFKLGIEPKLLNHPANCQLMVHSDNISKNKKSSLTLDELIVRINEWDLKYKNNSVVG